MIKLFSLSNVVLIDVNVTCRKDAGLFPDKVIGFFNWPNPSNRTMALGSTQPLTEMSSKNPPGVMGCRPARKVNNFAANYEPIV
jgi:hypothetical protein